MRISIPSKKTSISPPLTKRQVTLLPLPTGRRAEDRRLTPNHFSPFRSTIHRLVRAIADVRYTDSELPSLNSATSQSVCASRLTPRSARSPVKLTLHTLPYRLATFPNASIHVSPLCPALHCSGCATSPHIPQASPIFVQRFTPNQPRRSQRTRSTSHRTRVCNGAAQHIPPTYLGYTYSAQIRVGTYSRTHNPRLTRLAATPHRAICISALMSPS